jgi:hypothetical protein
MKNKRNSMKQKCFRLLPSMNLKIALVCDNLEMTQSDFIRESISNEFLRLQSAPSSQERLIA